MLGLQHMVLAARCALSSSRVDFQKERSFLISFHFFQHMDSSPERRLQTERSSAGRGSDVTLI